VASADGGEDYIYNKSRATAKTNSPCDFQKEKKSSQICSPCDFLLVYFFKTF